MDNLDRYVFIPIQKTLIFFFGDKQKKVSEEFDKIYLNLVARFPDIFRSESKTRNFKRALKGFFNYKYDNKDVFDCKKSFT